MAYTPTGPFQNNGTPAVNATFLNNLENGLVAAAANADAALSASSASTGFPGVVLLDSFSGATDDDKLDAALAYASGRPGGMTPTILLSGRAYTFTRSHTTFNGMRLSGNPLMGWNSLEIGGGNLAPTKVTFNGGINASSFLVGTAQNYYGYVGHIAFTSTNGASQFFHHPLAAGTAFCWTLDNLSFLGFKHVLGNPTNPWSATCCTIKGEWSIIAGVDVQLSLSGSDNNFWTDGSCNIGPDTNGNGAGKFLMICNSLGKTNIGGMYFTADAGWRAIRVLGGTSFGPGLYMTGFRIEGRNPTDPSYGALIKVESAAVQFRDTWLGYAMSSPSTYTDATDTGVVMVTGGDAIFDGVTYDRASGVGESTPLFRVTGGACEVNRVRTCTRGGSWAGKPVASQSASLIRADASVSLVTA